MEDDKQASERQKVSQGRIVEGNAGEIREAPKQVASGLELGLMAGLLPLQQGSEGAEPARTSLEEAALHSKEPAGMSSPGRASKDALGQEEGKPMPSTSEQSRDASQMSTGAHASFALRTVIPSREVHHCTYMHVHQADCVSSDFLWTNQVISWW